jgi:hypothetical protein
MDYQRIYNEFIADRRGKEANLIASGEYKERHHIVPRSLGGTDDASNMIALTFKDHLFAHLCLAKIHGGSQWYSVQMMAQTKRSGIPNHTQTTKAVRLKTMAVANIPRITLDECLIEARKFNRRHEWGLGHKSTYEAARKNGWLEQCVDHMGLPPKKWTLEECLAESQKHEKRSEWAEACQKSFWAAYKNGWMDQCCVHMALNYYTKGDCLGVALRFKNKLDWREHNPSMYRAAQREGWFDECTAHMDVLVRNNWTNEEVMVSAAACTNLKQWMEKDCAAVMQARARGIYSEATAHFKPLRGFINFDYCLSEAKKHKNTTAWGKSSPSTLRTAHKRGWLKEIVKLVGYSGNNKQILNRDTGEVFPSLKAAAEKYNINSASLSNYLAGRRKTAGGFRWAYA